MKTLNLSTLSAAQLEKEIIRREKIRSAICDEAIAAGMGYFTFADTCAAAKGAETVKGVEITPERLAICKRDVVSVDAHYDAIMEKRARMEYHGSMKPIKRPAFV